MKFAYEDLSDGQFEVLIVLLCQKLLGISVQGFAKGPDGGRDAKFVGTAELHPSRAAPWKGTTIIQAKHTNAYNALFSESDFYSKTATNTVLGKEVPRIKKLRDAGELDHYMLFANRRLAGNAESEIRAYLSEKTGLKPESLYLCGVEQLELWLKQFPEVAKHADLNPIDSPLLVSPDELSEIVEAFARNVNAVAAVVDDPPSPRIPYEVKNRVNQMSPEYARELRNRYLKDTRQIGIFLAAPENIELLRLYESVTEEFQLRIIAKRQQHQNFDSVMEYLVDLLFARDAVLRQRANKRLTRAMLFYMYWHCDIGETEDAATN